MTKTKKNTPIACTQTPKKTSLFDSIVNQEMFSRKEYDCQLYAQRVGLIRKVLVNRELEPLLWEFDTRLHEILKDFADRIDDELRKTEEDC